MEAQLNIVVSPVRVRVSPSLEGPAKQGLFDLSALILPRARGGGFGKLTHRRRRRNVSAARCILDGTGGRVLPLRRAPIPTEV
jgi:hypothetical protein